MQAADFSDAQIEAITEYIDSGAATKEDIARLEGKIDGLEGKVTWMFGVLVAGVASLVIKAFA